MRSPVQTYGGVDQPWVHLTLKPLVRLAMQHLQCDQRCRLGAQVFDDGTVVVKHCRDDVESVVTMQQQSTALPLGHDAIQDNLRRFDAMLEPLRLQHWHEPIPNWVGEG